MKEKAVLTCGKSGLGKTKGILFSKVEEMIQNDENILILDSKKEYYNQFSSVLKEKGYNTIVLNLKDPKHSNGYNPYTLPYYYYKNGDSDKAFELLDKIGNELFTDRTFSSDPFWENMASGVVTGLSIMLFKNAPIEKINLGSLNIGVNLCSDDILKNYLEKLDVNDPVYVSMSGTIFAPPETKGSILSVIRQKFRLYCFREKLMNMLSLTDFDIANIGKEKTCIFVIAREDSKSINDIANMIIEQIFSLVNFENIKFNFVLDNIETINYLRSLKTMIDMQSDDMNIYIATRNQDILKEQYRDSYLFANINKVINVEDEELEIKNDKFKPLELPLNEHKAEYFDLKLHLESELK